MTSPNTVRDPVCGTDVERAAAAGHSDYQGQTHYFCGSACKELFDLDPAQFAGAFVAAPMSDPVEVWRDAGYPRPARRMARLSRFNW